ncbi:hypothetical protein C0J52_17645 [Blattella germanica]|nr:hypothetical protein C0J52_17645 [Blattella germanica]
MEVPGEQSLLRVENQIEGSDTAIKMPLVLFQAKCEEFGESSLQNNETSSLRKAEYEQEGHAEAYYKEICDYLTSLTVPEGATDIYSKILKKRAQNYKINQGVLYYGHRHSRRVVTTREQQKEILEKFHIEMETELIADFICKSFCTFGFARCGVIGVTQEVLEAAKSKYEENVSQLQETVLTCGLIMPQLMSSCEISICNLISLLDENLSQSTWVGRILEEFVEANPDDWDVELEKFLFEFCTKTGTNSLSPFVSMFGRNPVCSLEEDKENCDVLEKEKPEVLYRRRKLQSKEARRQGTLEGQEPLAPITEREERLQRRIVRKRKKRLLKQGNLDRREWLLSIASHKLHPDQEPLPKDEHRAELQANTVAAVRELLALTKEERRRRGKYQKYSEEVQEEMARYAIEHGSLETVRHFSQHLGTTVSESTVRDIVKLYRAFTPELKEEIGRFAVHFGIDVACNHFTDRLGQEVRRGWVRKFKKIYLSHHPEIETKQSNNSKVRKCNTGPDTSKHKNKYSAEMKEEIGAYACQFGVPAALEHFSQKMPFPPKKCTVRKFRKLYLDKHKTSQQPGIPPQQQNNVIDQDMGPSTQTIDILHSSLNILNNAQMSSSNNIMYNNPFQSPSVPQFQSSNRLFPVPQGLGSGPPPFQPANIVPTVPSTTVSYEQHTPLTSSVVVSQNSVCFSQNSVPIQNFQQPRTIYSSYNNQGQPDGNVALSHKTMIPHPAAQAQSLVQHHSSSQIMLQSSVLNNSYGTDSQSQQYPHIPNHSVPFSHTHEQPNSIVQQVMPSAIAQHHLPQDSHLSHMQLTHAHHLHQRQHLPMEQQAQQHNQQPQQQTQPQNQQQNQLQHCQTQQQLQLEEPQSLPQKEQITSVSVKEPYREKRLQKEKDNTHLESSKEDSDDHLNIEETPKKKSRRGGHSVKKKTNSDGQKRGNYTLFSPEIRAEIGKYAAEHGSRRACRHFSEVLGHTVPESTICGLRDKYLLMTEECEGPSGAEKDITSLTYGPRGRPRRLGKYDEVVEECIRELVKSGEKVSSFLAIATAKQVLMQFEPGLLEENGGKVKLNVTWAKSFLKRIGVQNNN